MSRVLHLFLQALALLVHYADTLPSVVPTKYQDYVHLVVGIAQAILLWKSHEFNTDGTPQTVAFTKPGGPLVLALIALFIWSTPAQAQVTATFALQPYKAVKASFGSAVVTYSADVCNLTTTASDVDFGRVRQAAALKFAPTAAILAGPTITHARNGNKYVKASRLTEISAGLVTVLQVSKIISLGTTWGTVVAMVPQMAHELQGYFDQQGPVPVETFAGSFLPANGKFHLEAGSCVEYLLQGQYVKGLQQFSVEVK